MKYDLSPTFCCLAVALLTATCGGSGGSSGGPVAPPAPVPSASVEVTGELIFGSCAGAGCSYSIEYGNNGLGCANNLRGKVRIFNGDVLLETDDWFIEPSVVLPPAATVRVDDCCFSPSNIRLQTRFSSEQFWNNVACE